MRNLNFELKQMCRRNRDGSYATQRDRERVLDLVANQLQELGYRHMAAASLKPKHVKVWSIDGWLRVWQWAPSRTGWPNCAGGLRKSPSRMSSRATTATVRTSHRMQRARKFFCQKCEAKVLD
jgi:hypothetical protein